MADSTEQKIIERALEVLADIDGAGSYTTELGKTIVNGTEGPSLADSRPNWAQAELPAVSIFQGAVEVEDRDDENQKVLRRMSLVVRGFLERGIDAKTAREFLADIQRALRSAGDKFSVSDEDLTLYVQEGPHNIDYADSYEITGVEQQIEIFYVGSKLDLEA